MNWIFPCVHLGCGVVRTFCQLFRSCIKLGTHLMARSVFFISGVVYPTPLLVEREVYLFLCSSFLCNLKASWIIKPVIFQACKCFQHVALSFPESAHSPAARKTLVCQNHSFEMVIFFFGLGIFEVLILIQEGVCFSQTPTFKVMVGILLRA